MVLLKVPASVLRSILILGCTAPLFSQQTNLQISLMPKSLAGMDAMTTETDSESYLTSVTKRPSPFQPTTSDLLIGKAEEKFHNGRRAYQVKDTATARSEFDEAVDLMLQASESPTDRRLYESKLELMVDAIHRIDLAGLGAGSMIETVRYEKAPLDDILQMTFPVDPAIKGKVADEVKATSSQLPLAYNDAVLSYINYFSGRGHRTMVAGLERAAKYRPMISRVLAEEGVPQELIHLAQAESGFLPRAVSNRAAVGMWQFIQFRGREYGLTQSAYTDDRLDPEQATRAAAHHLHDLYNHFGDWLLAIAAYNCGPNAVEHAIERTGYADFWELRARRALPIETTNYVPIILAMTIMTKNADAYGLNDLNPAAPLEYDTVKVSSLTHLALVGDLTDTPVSQLLDLNPALIRNMAPASYDLHVPKGFGEQLQSQLDLFPESHRASWRMHRVEPGETLAAIAHRYNTAAVKITDVNRLDSNGPQAGDKLIIPTEYREPAPAAAKLKGRTAVAHRGLARGGSSLRASRATATRKRSTASHAVVRTPRRPTARRRA